MLPCNYNVAHCLYYQSSYAVAGKIKDITQKYDSNWMISTRKLRVESDWWEELIKPYHVKETKKTRLEDEQIQSMNMFI